MAVPSSLTIWSQAMSLTLGSLMMKTLQVSLLIVTSDVQARLKSREPAGPAIKSRAWAGPSAGLIGAGGSAQLAARP